MPLCDVCRSIDFFNLPPWPQHTLSRETGAKNPPAIVTISYEAKFSDDSEDEPEDNPAQTQVILHHDSLAALFESSRSCDLCDVIWSEVNKNIPVIEDHHKDFRHRDESEAAGRLYITKLSDREGDGFWLLYSIDSAEEYVLLATLGYSVEDCNIFSSEVFGRPVSPDPLNLRSLSWIKTSIENCVESHNHAEPETNLLPSRLLDLEFLGPGQTTIKLVDSYDPAIRYACLSHCWGSSKQGLTTSENLPGRYAGFDTSELPRTITDALIVTQALGLRYLWVDSVCICQDDKQEWEHEAALMHGVYENAFITIVAAKSNDDAMGFLSSRLEIQYASVPVTLNSLSGNIQVHATRFDDDFSRPFSTLHDEPWSKRAWTLQERYISKRSIIFGNSLTSFECDIGLNTEDGECKESYTNLHKHRVFLGEEVPPANTVSADPRWEALLEWNQIVKEYSRRKLKHPSDKLPALSGLASRYAKLICGEKANEKDYLAGVWRLNFVINLCWFLEGDFFRPSTYRGPSWSWTSVESVDGCCYRYSNFYSELAELEEVHVKLKGTNPFGEISDAWVQLNAIMMSVSEYSYQPSWNDPNFRRRWEALVSAPDKDECTGSLGSIDLEIDCRTDLTADEELPSNLRVLFLAYHPLKTGRYSIEGLLIVPEQKSDRHGPSGQAFRRVGYVYSAGKENQALGRYLLGRFNNRKLEKVVLV